MPKPRLHVCRCAGCRSRRPHPERRLHQQLNLLVHHLDERQRRWFAALEAERRGHGGTRQVAAITGLSERTIRRGRREWATSQVAHAPARVRAPGGGRWASERRDPALLALLAALLAPETAGDPQGPAKYKRSSLRTLSARLRAAGHPASPPTVARLLRQLGYSPKANVRRAEARTVPAERDAQFRHITAQRERFHAARAPVISVDTKKKELIGNFKNAGQTWCRTPEAVWVHDWPQDAVGQAIPYGIYDLTRNRGYVCVGDCHDTPRFAVEAIVDWWRDEGQAYGQAYGQAHCTPAQQLLILADAGGANSCRSRVWKAQLQDQLCDPYELTVTVCHYPSGCSKWNPVEHRLFSHISLNWAGVPLRSFELAVRYITGTTTTTGLAVTGVLKRGGNETGERVADAAMRALHLEHHAVCPQWNYTLRPRWPSDPV